MDRWENINWLKEAVVIVQAALCILLKWFILTWALHLAPLTTPAFTTQDGSTCQGSNGVRLKSFINSRNLPNLLLGNLNVGTLAGISKTYLWDIVYNSKQKEKKCVCIYIYSYCVAKIKVEKELLILIPQPRTSDANNDCQEQTPTEHSPET